MSGGIIGPRVQGYSRGGAWLRGSGLRVAPTGETRRSPSAPLTMTERFSVTTEDGTEGFIEISNSLHKAIMTEASQNPNGTIGEAAESVLGFDLYAEAGD